MAREGAAHLHDVKPRGKRKSEKMARPNALTISKSKNEKLLLFQIKCERYWPSEVGKTLTYGKVSVEFANEDVLSDYTCRTFIVSSDVEQRSVITIDLPLRNAPTKKG